jgi:hypothetical protein
MDRRRKGGFVFFAALETCGELKKTKAIEPKNIHCESL